MILDKEKIKNIIPHREPFLLLDLITELTESKINAEFQVRENDPLFANIYPGHYPGNPITPGVILCEIVFQAGAVLMGSRLSDSDIKGSPVVTRIRDCRFKNMVKPEDKVEIEVEFEDQISTAYYLKGTLKVNGKLAIRVAFTCALIEA